MTTTPTDRRPIRAGYAYVEIVREPARRRRRGLLARLAAWLTARR